MFAAGNCAIIKPSELSPNTAKLIEELVTKFLDQVSSCLGTVLSNLLSLEPQLVYRRTSRFLLINFRFAIAC